MQLTYEDFKRILNVGVSLSTQRDKNRILESVLQNAIETTNCDAGTLYVYEDNNLQFRIRKTLSMRANHAENGATMKNPTVFLLREENICAYAAVHGKIVNVSDIYHSEQFDFLGEKKYDTLMGYHTQSMLVVPVVNNENQLIGVLQLINAQDEEGNIIAFDSQYEWIIRSLSLLAAVEITNIQYVDEIKEQLHSFVEAMATAIDERTPYNGTHTRKVAEYVEKLANYMNRKYELGECREFFNDNRMEKLHLAALLHDIGKMVVPLNIMNRATRLDGNIKYLEERFLRLRAYYEIDLLKGSLSQKQYEETISYLDQSLILVHEIEHMGLLDDDSYQKVQKLASKAYVGADGKTLQYITEEERKCLSIRQGTLTEEARQQMESHVVMTAKILSKVHFNQNYKKVPKWAASHHEFMDGTGYPNHLSGEELDIETKMLTVADIYDALTATDRPYKEPMPGEEAIIILKSMAEEGKIELRLVEWLEEALKETEKVSRKNT